MVRCLTVLLGMDKAQTGGAGGDNASHLELHLLCLENSLKKSNFRCKDARLAFAMRQSSAVFSGYCHGGPVAASRN